MWDSYCGDVVDEAYCIGGMALRVVFSTTLFWLAYARMINIPCIVGVCILVKTGRRNSLVIEPGEQQVRALFRKPYFVV